MRPLTCLAVLLFAAVTASAGITLPDANRTEAGCALARTVCEAADFGVREGDCLQTEALQRAIDEAGRCGGIVRIPAGVYRTGGLVLRSGVTLELAEGAVLEGSRDPADYPGTTHWHRALVRADGATDIGIVGGRFSVLDGRDVFDPAGEEGYRGPHGIMLTGCTNVTLRGYTVRDSGNWAHALFRCANVRMADVRVFGGHDACDFHASENVVVERCEFRTGDDSVAGFANRDCIVRDCLFDTSCQAVRMGGSNLLFERCRLVHPSSFANRGNLKPEEKRLSAKRGDGVRHGVSAGVIYYCDTRWEIDRPQGNIVFRDCEFDRPGQVFALDYDGRNMWCCRHPLESIAFEGCTFRLVERPISIFGDEERPLDFTMRDCTVSAAPGAGKRPLVTAYNFRKILLENVRLEGFDAPHLVTRSRGEVEVRGGTAVENVFRPDPNDKILTFDEIDAALAKLPADEAAWKAWSAGVKTPDESRWNEEKGLYALPDDPFRGDGWGSAMAVLRGETPHAARIGRAFCRQYKYFCGWDRTGAVSQTQRGTLSPMPAGAFGYALSLFDPLFARTFFTDFLRRKDLPPAAVFGARLAVGRIRRMESVETTFVVDDSEAYNAWPAIRALKGGLLVVYSHTAGHVFTAGKVGCSYARISRDGARTWSDPAAFEFDEPAADAWGPCGAAAVKAGDALFWHRYWKGAVRWQTLVRTDDGRRFEAVAKPKFDPMPVQMMDPVDVPGLGLVSLWFSGDYGRQDGHSWGLAVSTDAGRTWRQQVVEDGLRKADWPTEPSLVWLGGRRLLALARCEQRCEGNPVRRLFSMTSDDLGRTWKRQLTNIGDVLESTPSVLYDRASDVLTLYYFHRGPGLLKMRTALAAEAFATPTVWSEPHVVACGRLRRDWDSGNVNAVRLNGSDYLAYYAGNEKVSSVLVSVTGAGATPADSWEGRRVLLLGTWKPEAVRALVRERRCEAHVYATAAEARLDFPAEAFARVILAPDAKDGAKAVKDVFPACQITFENVL